MKSDIVQATVETSFGDLGKSRSLVDHVYCNDCTLLSRVGADSVYPPCTSEQTRIYYPCQGRQVNSFASLRTQLLVKCQ